MRNFCLEGGEILKYAFSHAAFHSTLAYYYSRGDPRVPLMSTCEYTAALVQYLLNGEL